MGLGSPGGINIQIPSKIMPFHSICPRMFKKDETVTTKSLNSNDYFNLSSIVMHRRK